ncbi:HAD family phosphatase [Paraburkholderia sediminicola]|uniref:HAD family hydrolase n=1 Tax=Paraburkholderia sediminicola TaxID=458836 RepID=UPI0038BC23FF
MFAAAIFDMDGLLVDSERTIMDTWISVGLDLGIALAPRDYLRIVGRSSAECELILTELLGGAATFREALTRVREQLSRPSAHPIFPLKSGAQSLLGELARVGVPCAVASSSPLEEIKSRLGRVGILHFFKAIAGGDEVARGKPDPAVYRLAAHRLGVSEDACLAFEDSENGARAAVGAGIAVVTVPDLIHPTDEVAVLSFRILRRLDGAIEFVPDWFGTHDMSGT